MCWLYVKRSVIAIRVSVAGCLGYDVLEILCLGMVIVYNVSVAGCLGYDVLEKTITQQTAIKGFQLLVV